jgi:hypothetical protein
MHVHESAFKINIVELLPNCITFFFRTLMHFSDMLTHLIGRLHFKILCLFTIHVHWINFTFYIAVENSYLGRGYGLFKHTIIYYENIWGLNYSFTSYMLHCAEAVDDCTFVHRFGQGVVKGERRWGCACVCVQPALDMKTYLDGELVNWNCLWRKWRQMLCCTRFYSCWASTSERASTEARMQARGTHSSCGWRPLPTPPPHPSRSLPRDIMYQL